MDLVQAEAVLDLVEGRSRALHGSAVFRLERGLSRRIAELREELIGLEANLVLHIDFPEEDDAPVPLDTVLASASGLRDRLDELLATAPEGELLREGALTVLAGPPNSGKSSLYNALLGEERAIVTEVPGTTRDALEVVVSLGGFPFRIVDTAGIRETEEVVERLGVEVARRYLKRADLVLFCVESHEDIGPGEREFLEGLGDVPVVLLRTKSDLVDGEAECDAPTPGVREVVSLSVVEGTGLGRLRKLLPSLVYGGLVQTGVSVPALTRRRQTEGVRSARDHVAVFIEDLEGGIPAEMAATHLRPAETALEELLGVISTDEILDRIFHDFCIGK
jgi:tRNA modification GTPase